MHSRYAMLSFQYSFTRLRNVFTQFFIKLFFLREHIEDEHQLIEFLRFDGIPVDPRKVWNGYTLKLH